jgi:hypothetical protein
MSQPVMKLRVLDNSIRLRLTRSEVDAALQDGLVKGRVTFPASNSFAYVLESSPAAVSSEAKISNNVLTVRIPESEIRAWASSEQVSIAAEQVLDEGGYLKILVEKDFACLAPREGEDESDMFAHPREGQDNC